MKTLIVTAAIAAMLATPALANKTLVNPVEVACSAQVAQLQEQIVILKKELAAQTQAQATPVKPVDHQKKEG